MRSTSGEVYVAALSPNRMTFFLESVQNQFLYVWFEHRRCVVAQVLQSENVAQQEDEARECEEKEEAYF